MTGETTVRHAHRTVSSSGASVSEPEVARPLITPDEAMRLGSSEALIFTSGRPAIRATKFRYYSDPSFKRLAQIAPPPKSDRIAHPPTVADCKEQPKNDEQNGKPAQLTPDQVATGKVRRHKTAAAEQLSFLKFAVENGNGTPDKSKEQDVKERLL